MKMMVLEFKLSHQNLSLIKVIILPLQKNKFKEKNKKIIYPKDHLERSKSGPNKRNQEVITMIPYNTRMKEMAHINPSDFKARSLQDLRYFRIQFSRKIT